MRPTIFKWVEGEGFLLAIDQALDRQTLGSSARVEPDTYAAEILDRVLCCVFGGLVDFAAEYATYYERDYTSLADFLQRRFCLPEDVAETLAQEPGAERALYRGDLHSGGDDVVGQWIESDTGERTLRRILQCAEDEASDVTEEYDEDQE